MARELPVDYQQRVPYELLTELASSLAQVRHFYRLFISEILYKRSVPLRRAWAELSDYVYSINIK